MLDHYKDTSMEPERAKAIAASHLILRREDGMICFIKRKDHYRDSHYQAPAGKANTGEVPSETAAREGGEEAGIHVVPSDVQLIHTMFRPKHDKTGDRVDFFFVTELWEGEPHNAEPDKCYELIWRHPNDMPEPMIPHVRHGIEQGLAGVTYSEFGYDLLRQHGYME